MFVNVGLATTDPEIEQFYARQAVAFIVIDSCEGDSARGDYAGPLPGVVRPLLDWKTVLTHEPVNSER
jgi:lipopolysaccharide transport system ATP-binding protein